MRRCYGRGAPGQSSALLLPTARMSTSSLRSAVSAPAVPAKQNRFGFSIDDVGRFRRRRNHLCNRHRLFATPSESNNDDDDDPTSFDIDALASALSRAAAEERLKAEGASSSDEDENVDVVDVDVDAVDEDPLLPPPSPLPPVPPPPTPTPMPTSSPSASPFGADAKAREQEVLDELGGDGGFEPDEIELLQELGRVSWMTSDASPVPSSLSSLNSTAPRAAAVVYAARYTPPTPLMSPVVVLVKEYLPHASSLACNELQVGARLSSGGALPARGRKWHAARGDGPPPPAPPAALPLLGWFEASSAPSSSQEEEEDEVEEEDSPSTSSYDGNVVDSRSLWLVFKWGGLQPLSFYPRAEQRLPRRTGLAALLPSPPPERQREEALEKRKKMVRRIAAGATAALATVHAAGVAHGSLGGGCVLLSSFDDADSARLRVCLDNFGFATMRRRTRRKASFSPDDFELAEDDDPVLVAQAADARQLGRLLLETALLALGETAATATATATMSSSSPSSPSSSSEDRQESFDFNAYASLESAGPAVREAGARVLEAVASAVESSSSSPSPSSRKSRMRRSRGSSSGNDDDDGSESEILRESEGDDDDDDPFDADPSVALAAEAARGACARASNEWRAAVALLDEDGGAGWELVGALASGVLPARLVGARFFL